MKKEQEGLEDWEIDQRIDELEELIKRYEDTPELKVWTKFQKENK